SAPAATTVHIDGGAGYDSVTLVGGATAETATVRPGSIELVAGGLSATATSVESTRVTGSILDAAILYDSAGADRLDANVASTTLSGPGFTSRAEGFGHLTINAHAGGGGAGRVGG